MIPRGIIPIQHFCELENKADRVNHAMRIVTHAKNKIAKENPRLITKVNGQYGGRRAENIRRNLRQLFVQEWQSLDDYMLLARPFWDATLVLEAEEKSTISKLLPMLHGIRLVLKEVHTVFKAQLLEKLDVQFQDYIDPTRKNFDPTFVVATALDPSAVLCLTKAQLAAAEAVIRKSIQPSDSPPSSQVAPVPPSERNSPVALLMESMAKKQREAHLSAKQDPEYDRYKQAKFSLGFKENLLDFWSLRLHVYPRLAAFAIDLLAIPASSAGIERVFSMAGHILGLRRGNLADKGLEEAVKIKVNRRFVAPELAQPIDDVITLN